MDNNIQLFENKRIRTAWDEKNEEWLFSIIDVVEVLTGTGKTSAKTCKRANLGAIIPLSILDMEICSMPIFSASVS